MTNRPGRLMVSPDPRRARTEARGANRTRWRCFVNLLVADWVFPPLFPKASPMPRHTSLGPDSFDSVWGYCAVVGTRELLWSGHRIPEPASLSELDDNVAAPSAGLAQIGSASCRERGCPYV